MNQFEPTLRPKMPFVVEQEIDKLKKAFKGLGTDEKAVNEVIGRLSLQQRFELADVYKLKFNKNLVDELKSELSGDYLRLALALFLTPVELLAHDLFTGIKKSGVNYAVLNEILCCCNNPEIQAIKEAYSHLDKTKTLEQAVAAELSGDYERLILDLLHGDRDEDDPERVERAIQTGNFSQLINQDMLEDDVDALLQALRAKTPHNATLIGILTSRSKHHIRAICQLYQERANEHLVDTITEKVTEPLRTGLNTVVMALIDLRLLMTCQIFECFQGKGMRVETLIRLVVLRSEIDLQDIKTLFAVKFGKQLSEWIRTEAKGDLRHLLLCLTADA